MKIYNRDTKAEKEMNLFRGSAGRPRHRDMGAMGGSPCDSLVASQGYKQLGEQDPEPGPL